ncbi:MAG: protein kinase [Candidatus Aminicenantes bacterium]|nr:protein kinase [Candidatus Aminicenantes bacterium]
MGVECPKCKTENTSDSEFCKKCATPLPSSKDIPVTETLETPTEELTRGTVFADRYEIIEELGKGGMGKVYRVEDKKIKEEVALKLIKPEIASDKKTIARFSNELKMARKIAHRNVCKMYDLGEEKGTHYITMEYVPGEDLKSFIRRAGLLSAGKTVFIAKQVVEGLTEAHRLGVIHRDLKPQNIMIDEEGNARIMDFGIARAARGKGITAAGVMVGTPEYMSPEQAEVKEVDQRSDIYSLGVILYEMVTGRVPFEGETALGIAMKHKSEMPQDPKEINAQIPDDLSKVILRCMEKAREKRYQSAGEVRAELIKIQKGIPTTEHVAPRKKPITSKEITVSFSLRKLFVPAAILGVVVIALVVIWLVMRQREPAFAPKIENSIAIISFENQTGDKAYDYLQKAIPNLLITSLEQAGGLYVMTWERMHDLLDQMGKKDVENIDRDLGFRLCRIEGVVALVRGSFVKAGDMFATDVKVLDVETKRLLKGVSSRGEGVDSILKTQIDELSKEIFEGIGAARPEIEPSKITVAEVTTGSMEAYRYFLSGAENVRKFYNEDARKDLEKAVDIDPTFATAYLYLAGAYGGLGNIEARDRAINKAKSFSEKATEKERLLIEAGFIQYIERDMGKLGNILRQITEKYPREKIAHQALGSFFLNAGFYKQAIEQFNKALELDPGFAECHNALGYTYIRLEDYEKAIEHFKEYMSLNPGEPNPHDSIADAYVFIGRLDEAVSHYKEAVRIKSEFPSYFKLGYIYALKEEPVESMKWIDKYISMSSSEGLKLPGYLFRGFYKYWLGSTEQAFIDLQRAEKLADEVGSGLTKAAVRWIEGAIYRDRGELELARRNNDSWLDEYEKNRPVSAPFYKARHNFLSALIDLKEGKLDSAKNRLAKVKMQIAASGGYQQERTTFLSDILEAEILLAEGNTEQSIAALEEKSLSRVKPPALQYVERMIFYNMPELKDVLARAYQEKGDLDSAIAEYERLVTFDPKSTARYLVHPLCHYRLAKLYEEKGWEGKAIEQYEQFLDLWKNADLGKAEVEDARQRLSGLK